MEAGKTYKKLIGNQVPCKVIWSDEKSAVVVYEGGEMRFMVPHEFFSDYIEVPPITKVVGYYNVYSLHGVYGSLLHPTRSVADAASASDRIACKRIEFTYSEGEYDV